MTNLSGYAIKQNTLNLQRRLIRIVAFNISVDCLARITEPLPLFDYQKVIFDTLMLEDGSFKDKHLYLLKSTGLGASELFLRIMAWLCTKDNTYTNSQIVVVTGPNWDLSIKLMKRLKAIFEPKLNIIFQDKETVLNLNGCVIESFPSNHLSSFRSLTNPAFILCDESDMFRTSEQEEVRHVTERYVGKSNPYIVMVSTPGDPLGLMASIKKEPEETCIYRRLFMDWTYGIGKIYSAEDIAKARMSPSWEREYCNKFTGRIGNLLSPLKIDTAIDTGNILEYIQPNTANLISCGIDPAFGSSAFAIGLTEYIKEENKIRVLSAEQYENHPDPQDMIDRIFDIHRQYWNCWFFVDSSARGFITSLKIAFGENPNYTKVEDVNPGNNFIIPVNFSTDNKKMISHLAALFNDEYIGVADRHDKLIVALKSAQVNEYLFLKDQSAYNDLTDAISLSLRCYNVN